MGKRLRVLLIEDEVHDQMVCKRAIRHLPIELSCVGSLAEAQEILKRTAFDCVWLDRHLPDGDGITLLDWLEAEVLLVPVIVITGDDRLEDGVLAVQRGAQDYVVKGQYTGAALVASTRYAIERTQNQELRRQIAAQERVVAFGRLAAGAAHSINNPLTAIVANQQFVHDGLEGLGAELQGPPRAQLTELMSAAADSLVAAKRVAQVVAQMASFAQQPSPRGDVDLDALVRDEAASLARRGHEVVIETHAQRTVRGSEDDLGGVVRQLLENAVIATAAVPDAIHVRTDIVDGQFELTVEDSGVGVDESLADTIFDPFVSTQRQRAGLGLAICAEVVGRHRGTLRLESLRGPTRFVVRLPVFGVHLRSDPPTDAGLVGAGVAVHDPARST